MECTEQLSQGCRQDASVPVQLCPAQSEPFSSWSHPLPAHCFDCYCRVSPSLTLPFLLNHIYIAGLHFQGPRWIIYLQLTYHLSDSIGLPALTSCQPVMLISIWTQFPTCMICLSSCSSSCWWQRQQEMLTIARLQAHRACWTYCQH